MACVQRRTVAFAVQLLLIGLSLAGAIQLRHPAPVAAQTSGAAIYAPSPGSTLTATWATVAWSAVAGVQDYQLKAGTTPGGQELASQDLGSQATQTLLNPLPADGRTVYLTLNTLAGGTWYSTSASYTAMTAPAGTALLLYPGPGAVLPGSTVTVQWSDVGATDHNLYAGRTQGGSDYSSQTSLGRSLQTTLSGLPVDGSDVYLSLWSLTNGVGGWITYRYRASGATDAATITAPAAGSQLATSATFSWAAGSGATGYTVTLGTSPGGAEIASRNAGLATQTTIGSLPQSAVYLYLRLTTQNYRTTVFTDYLYVSCCPLTVAPGPVSMSSPPNNAVNTGVTPLLTWAAPAGVNLDTTYTVSIYDPYARPAGQTQSGQKLADIDAGLSLSVRVPGSEGLQSGTSYLWNVSACNGTACSAFASSWFTFSTYTTPGTPQQQSPANGAGYISPTTTLSWSASAGAVSGTTTYSVSIWDPYGGPAGHLLGDLFASTYTSIQVPASEGLLPGQTYYWNVSACGGTPCSGYNATWYAFTTMPQPAATLSAAVNTEIGNPDFAGAAVGATSVPGWSGTLAVAADPGGFNYLQQVDSLTSAALTLDFPSQDENGVYVSYVRIGYRTNNSTYTAPLLQFNGHYLPIYGAASSGWQEAIVAVPYWDGPTGQFIIGSFYQGAQRPDIAYLQRLDGPMSRNGTSAGLVTGAYATSTTDLSLPGVMGISFGRSYSSQSVSTGVPLSGSGLAGGGMGAKWWHTWQYRLTPINSRSVAIQRPGGSIEFFTYTWKWTPPPGSHETLTQNGLDWTLTTPGQQRYLFTQASSSAAGVLTQVLDRNNNATVLGYDTSQRLSRISDPGGRFISLSWNGSGQIASISDSAGRSVVYSYSGSDLTGVQDVLGGATSFGYTGSFLQSTTDPLRDVVLQNSYDSLGRLTDQADAAGGHTTYAYDTPGKGATRISDARGKPRTYYFDQGLRVTDTLDAYGKRVSGTHDADNNLVSATNAIGAVQVQTYDANGNVLTRTDAWNEVWTYTYDAQNNPLTATDPLGHVITATYDAIGNMHTLRDAASGTVTTTVDGRGRVTAVQDQRGNSTTTAYNASGDKASVTDALGHTTTTAYDAAGRATSDTDPLGHATSTTYNAAGAVLSVTDALGHSISTTYDADGHKLTATDANNHATTYGYDGRGKLTSVTDALGGLTRYGYDAAGNRTSVTDALNHTTSYSFDDMNRPLTVTNAAGTVTLSNSYDDSGRIISITDAKGQVTHLAYTLRDQLQTTNYADSMSVTNQYDALGNRTQQADSTGITSYTYDALNRLSSDTALGRTVGYGYDAAGNRTSLTYPGGQVVSYVYDAANRLSTVSDWNGATTSYSYDAANRQTTTTLPASTGITSTSVFNAANQLQSVTHSRNGTVLASASYTLDAVGNRTSKTTAAGTESYTLDALDRLTSVTPPGGAATTYSYDAVGNRLSLTTATSSISYGYDNLNQLVVLQSPGSPPAVEQFDANGSQLTNRNDTLGWDAANRLVSQSNGVVSTSMTYNGDNLRQSRSSGGTTTSFVWDLGSKTPVVLDDGSQYLYGRGLLATVIGGARYDYLADGLGSIVAMVDGNGSIVQSYDYDAFGAVTQRSGQASNEFQFAGQQTDPSGLQYLRARYYDPTTGRFLSRDTLSVNDPAGHHSFSYGSNNPALRVDPSGMADFTYDEWQQTQIDQTQYLEDCETIQCFVGWDGRGGSGGLVFVGMLLVVGGTEYIVSFVQHFENLLFFAKQKSDNYKNTEQRKSEQAVMNEIYKGLSKPEQRRLHDKLPRLKDEWGEVDIEDLINERNSLFPDKPYPGGWLDHP